MDQTLEHQRTARLAYQIWENEGCPEGKCEVHWSEAEQQVRAEREATANTAPMRDTRPVLAARSAAAMQVR